MVDLNSTLTKTCKQCLEEKSISDFHAKKRGMHGVRATCKKCRSENDKKWLYTKEERSIYYFEHKDKEKLRDRKDKRKQYYEKNRASITKRLCKYAKENPEKYASRAMHRIAIKNKATTKWTDLEKIKSIYAEAKRLSEQTGISWHVDHIVPLKSNIVCGLHVHQNLEVITAKANIAKSNRTWPDMP